MSRCDEKLRSILTTSAYKQTKYQIKLTANSQPSFLVGANTRSGLQLFVCCRWFPSRASYLWANWFPLYFDGNWRTSYPLYLAIHSITSIVRWMIKNYVIFFTSCTLFYIFYNFCMRFAPPIEAAFTLITKYHSFDRYITWNDPRRKESGVISLT